MNEVRLVGQFTGPDRRLFVVRIENLGDLPESLPVGVRAFVLFTAVDATAASEQQLKDFARKWLELGCVWACAVYAADPECDAMVAVAESNWVEQIEVCLADSKTWSDKLVAGQEEENV